MRRRLALVASFALVLAASTPACASGQMPLAGEPPLVGSAAAAQRPSLWELERRDTDASPMGAALEDPPFRRLIARVPERRIQAEPTPSPAKPTLLSAALPGVGQLTLGQRRGWLYLALEAVAWGLYLDRRAAGVEGRDAYRDFAWEEARLRNEPRVEGGFDYYETMSKWDRSGAFDVDPDASGVQPEPDMTTYNGTIWVRATGIFAPGDDPPDVDPGYQRALAYYSDRAYGSAFLWDWGGDGAARETYSDMIRSSDDRFRQATNVLGAIIANHVVSAVDAFFSARGLSAPVEARLAATQSGAGARWTAMVSVPGAP